jgi:hypothetical protein
MESKNYSVAIIWNILYKVPNNKKNKKEKKKQLFMKIELFLIFCFIHKGFLQFIF